MYTFCLLALGLCAGEPDEIKKVSPPSSSAPPSAKLPGPTQHGSIVFQPTAAEADVPAPFRLPASTFTYDWEKVYDTERLEVWGVRFPSPIVSPDASNNTVHAEYFRPKVPGKRPAVVVLHILGADFALSRYMAARFANEGIAALFVQLPYYGNRRPGGEKGEARFLSANAERSISAMRQGVCDVRRGVCWLASRPEVDAQRLGVTGISLGGIVSAVAAEAEPAIGRVVTILAGGDLAEILWTMPEAAKYRKLWTDSGRSFADLKTLTDPFDPLTYASRLRGKRMLMIAGNVDEVIPPASVRKLWDAAGRPPIVWYDCGHFSAAGYFFPSMRRSIDFFLAD